MSLVDSTAPNYEGKGAIAAALATRVEEDQLAMIRVGGPNAGHTAWDSEDIEWKLRHIPVGAVVRDDCQLWIGPGSDVNPDVLAEEIRAIEKVGCPVLNRLVVDKNATLIEPLHVWDEQAANLVERIGSTGKGVGAARAARIMRTANTFGGTGDVREAAREWLDSGGTVIVEATQGYGLGLHGRHYPKCTSSDCDAQTMLSMAGIIGWSREVESLEVWVVFRTLPIRVAGNSGELRNETTWGELGLPAEHTTVTQKIRRVGTWDADLAREALVANGGPGGKVKVALTGLDLLFGGLKEMRGKWQEKDDLMGAPKEVMQWVIAREEEIGCGFDAIGIGPRTDDVLWSSAVGSADEHVG